MDSGIRSAGVNEDRADIPTDLTGEFPANGIFGSNPGFQGQQGDAFWCCSDVDSWTLPDAGSGAPVMAELIDWQAIDDILDAAQKTTAKESTDDKARIRPEESAFALGSPQQVAGIDSVSRNQPSHQSNDTAHGTSNQTNGRVVPLSATAENPAGLVSQLAAPRRSNRKAPSCTVNKAVGSRKGPIPATPHIPQQQMALAQPHGRGNGFSAQEQTPARHFPLEALYRVRQRRPNCISDCATPEHSPITPVQLLPYQQTATPLRGLASPTPVLRTFPGPVIERKGWWKHCDALNSRYTASEKSSYDTEFVDEAHGILQRIAEVVHKNASKGPIVYSNII